MTKTRKKIRLGLIIICIAGVGALLLLVFAGLVEDESNFDAALVLGNKVELDGTPSARLVARLDRAITLWNDDRLKWVIVSGGTGIEGFDEAKVMAGYLIAKGIPKASIIIDSDGIDTWSSAINAKRLTEDLQLESVIAISQFFHLARCRLALRRAGFTSIGSSYARYFAERDIYGLIRELPAYVKYWLWKAKLPRESASANLRSTPVGYGTFLHIWNEGFPSRSMP